MSRLAGVRVVSEYGDARDVLKDRGACPVNHNGRSAPFVGGTLITLHGDEHLRRRRLEAPLFTRDALARYELDVLAPAIERAMSPIGERADLVALSRAMLLQIAAAIIGLDDVHTDARIDRLGACMDKLIDATHVEWSGDDRDRIVREAQRARDVFDREFVTSSLRRRESEPQHDLLSLIADLDHDAIVREAILYLVAATVTTATLVTHTVDEIGRLQQDVDPEFLRAAAEESLRLHVPTAALLRRVADETVACDLGAANRDDAVFGPDPDRFRVGRDLPSGVTEHGLAFGAGQHVCIGRFLALPAATGPALGIVVRILEALYAAGVEPDPDRAPRRLPGELDAYATYPVRFVR